MKHVGRLIACMIVLAGSGSFGYTTKTCEPGEYIDGYCIISGTSPHQSCAAHDDEPLKHAALIVPVPTATVTFSTLASRFRHTSVCRLYGEQ